MSDESLGTVVGYLGELTGNPAFPILSYVDDEGYPVNVRVRAEWNGDVRFRVTAPKAATPAEGQRCCLLWHRHDEVLFDLASITLFGAARLTGDGLEIEIDRKPIVSNFGEPDWEEAFRVFAQNSANYLRDYGLTEPDLNWDVLERLARESIDRYGDPAA
ncbi:hypothetical protein G7043_29905 [Lentzea sp. NEAU-D13]|uniref:Uncharacterized protein n=1 Tax=Lentzea alba TaxID=2714351 RepID=A0A7C9W095_9PSEU|nr:hypothetical protein [Lentzea alba]NGY63141.1 hypothetical protein [Lentzea alba]